MHILFKRILIRYRSRNQFKRYSRLAKEGGWLIFGQTASMLGALVLVRVLTEYLSPTQYGQLALGLTLAGLVNQVVMGGVTNGIGRFYPIAAEKSDLESYFNASKRMMVYATGVVVVFGIVLGAGLVWLQYSQWMGLAAATLILSLLNGYSSALNGIQNAARQRSVVALHRGLNAWLKIVFAVGVMLWLGSSETSVVIGYSISTLLIIGSQWYLVRRTYRNLITTRESENLKEGVSWVKKMWSYSWPFSTWGIFTWLQQSSDRWVLEIFSSTQDVGYYAVLYQVGYTPVVLMTGMAIIFLGPILFQRSGDASDQLRNDNVSKLVWRITFVSLCCTLIGFGLTLTLHEWFFNIVVVGEYHVVSNLLPWMVLAGGIFGVGQLLSLKLMSEMKSSVMTSAKIITAILGILFNFVGATLAGLQGVVAALVAFSIVFCLWMAYIAFKTPMERLQSVESR